jgi:hypothetical protein
LVWEICGLRFRLVGIEVGLCRSGPGHRRLGRTRSYLPLLRHRVTRDQHRYHHRHLPHGFSDTEHAESWNRNARTINLKLNELIRAIDKARDQMIDIENLSDLELDDLQAKYEKMKAECTERPGRNRAGTLQDAND